MSTNFSLFDPTSGFLVAQEESSACRMSIREDGDLRWMVSEDGVLHGAMSISAPSKPVLPSINAMLFAENLRSNPERILCLGLGTGSIERYLAEAQPAAKISSVEISQARYEQVQQHFGLPAGCTVILQDAKEVIESDIELQDLIYCDLFDTSDRFNSMLSEHFIKGLCSKLSPFGVVAINYVYEDQKHLIDTLVKLRSQVKNVAIAEIEDHANIVIFGLNGELENQYQTYSAQQTAAKNVNADFLSNAIQIKWLPQTLKA